MTARLQTKGKAPGVYIQEITLPGPIAGVSTSIAAFVGPAEKGPLRKPTLVTNIDQFESIFGGYVEDPYRVYAAHAVRGFFAEGGLSCYFVRVGTGAQASLELKDRKGRPTLVVTALKEGIAGNNIPVAVADASIANTRVARFAPINIAAGGAPTNQRNVTTGDAADAAKFKPGDVVILTNGANSERATIASIAKDAVANTSTFTMVANLTNDYGGGTIAIADIAPGQRQIRVDATAGIQPGSYVEIAQGAVKETAVVRLVDQINKVLMFDAPLVNAYPLNADATVTTLEFTLTVTAPGVPAENFTTLSLDPRHSRYFATNVTSASVSVDLSDPPTPTPPADNRPVALGVTNLAGGAVENLALLTPAHYQAAIDTLQKVDEVNLLCVPDAVTADPKTHFDVADTQAIQAYMVAHCEKMQDRFAILDASELLPTAPTFDAVVNQRNGLSSDGGYAALYFPWIKITNPAGKGSIAVPPSGHVAGVFANNDDKFGVFKAPANERITTALAVEVKLSDDEQGPLNDQGINVIRTFKNEGIKIWGARTIAPPNITAWRFVNVRRLLLFIEESIQEGTRFAVFEPNNLSLWGQVKRLVDDFLTDQWTQGALFGPTPERAFRVRVDETLNPPALRAQGILVVEVTVVPTTPAEFIIFQVIQDITGTSLQEKTA
jgi:phage tail sheath protein FI